MTKADYNLFRSMVAAFEAKLDELEVLKEEEPDKLFISKQKDSHDLEILEELLDLMRQQNRIINSPENLLPPLYMREIIAQTKIFSRAHPAFSDLEENWFRIRTEIRRIPEGQLVPQSFVLDMFNQIRRPIEYILGRSAGTFRRRPMDISRTLDDVPPLDET